MGLRDIYLQLKGIEFLDLDELCLLLTRAHSMSFSTNSAVGFVNELFTSWGVNYYYTTK